MDLDDLVPIIERKLPFLEVKRCTFEENGNNYDGLAFVHPDRAQEPERVFMTTLVVVGDEIVFGIHASNRHENMTRPLEGCDIDHLASILMEVWGNLQPN